MEKKDTEVEVTEVVATIKELLKAVKVNAKQACEMPSPNTASVTRLGAKDVGNSSNDALKHTQASVNATNAICVLTDIFGKQLGWSR